MFKFNVIFKIFSTTKLRSKNAKKIFEKKIKKRFKQSINEIKNNLILKQEKQEKLINYGFIDKPLTIMFNGYCVIYF